MTYSFIESFEVDSVLGVGKFLTVVLALNLQLFTDGLCSQLTVARDVNDFNLYTQRNVFNKNYLSNCVNSAIKTQLCNIQ